MIGFEKLMKWCFKEPEAVKTACEMPTLAPPLNVQALVTACGDFNRKNGF